MRSVPKPSAGHGLSAASQSVADCVELTPVSLELLALGIDVVRLEPRLDRLEVPVAEVVEGEVVQAVDRVREVELVEVALDLGAGGVDARDDPALFERGRPRLDPLTALHQQEAARVPELV